MTKRQTEGKKGIQPVEEKEVITQLIHMGMIVVNSAKYLKACEHIGAGDSVVVACRKEGTTDKGFYKALIREDDPKLGEAYSRARKQRAFARFEEIDEIKRKTMLSKDDPEYLDPQAANVVINAIKWQAGKENQGLFGDHVTHEITTGKPQLTREEQLAQLRDSGLRIADVFASLTKDAAPAAGELIEIGDGAEPGDQGEDEDLSGLDDGPQSQHQNAPHSQ